MFFKIIGIEFGVKKILFNGKKVKIQLWDVSGQKQYRSIVKAYFKASKAIILVYDVANESSFLAINDWIKEIKKDEINPIFALVGQKCDLNERIISEEKGREMANELGVEFFEISAKTGQNVEELFNYLIQQCIFAANNGNPDLGSK